MIIEHLLEMRMIEMSYLSREYLAGLQRNRTCCAFYVLIFRCLSLYKNLFVLFEDINGLILKLNYIHYLINHVIFVIMYVNNLFAVAFGIRMMHIISINLHSEYR